LVCFFSHFRLFSLQNNKNQEEGDHNMDVDAEDDYAGAEEEEQELEEDIQEE
jgi:hypothetical protein